MELKQLVLVGTVGGTCDRHLTVATNGLTGGYAYPTIVPIVAGVCGKTTTMRSAELALLYQLVKVINFIAG